MSWVIVASSVTELIAVFVPFAECTLAVAHLALESDYFRHIGHAGGMDEGVLQRNRSVGTGTKEDATWIITHTWCVQQS